jgi:hypothetical protein
LGKSRAASMADHHEGQACSTVDDAAVVPRDRSIPSAALRTMRPMLQTPDVSLTERFRTDAARDLDEARRSIGRYQSRLRLANAPLSRLAEVAAAANDTLRALEVIVAIDAHTSEPVTRRETINA